MISIGKRKCLKTLLHFRDEHTIKRCFKPYMSTWGSRCGFPGPFMYQSDCYVWIQCFIQTGMSLQICVSTSRCWLVPIIYLSKKCCLLALWLGTLLGSSAQKAASVTFSEVRKLGVWTRPEMKALAWLVLTAVVSPHAPRPSHSWLFSSILRSCSAIFFIMPLAQCNLTQLNTGLSAGVGLKPMLQVCFDPSGWEFR